MKAIASAATAAQASPTSRRQPNPRARRGRRSRRQRHGRRIPQPQLRRPRPQHPHQRLLEPARYPRRSISRPRQAGCRSKRSGGCPTSDRHRAGSGASGSGCCLAWLGFACSRVSGWRYSFPPTRVGNGSMICRRKFRISKRSRQIDPCPCGREDLSGARRWGLRMHDFAPDNGLPPNDCVMAAKGRPLPRLAPPLTPPRPGRWDRGSEGLPYRARASHGEDATLSIQPGATIRVGSGSDKPPGR